MAKYLDRLLAKTDYVRIGLHEDIVVILDVTVGFDPAAELLAESLPEVIPIAPTPWIPDRHFESDFFAQVFHFDDLAKNLRHLRDSIAILKFT
jgi:hypothetical protein